MTIYTIADETHETYGHGDFGTEQRILRQGSYGCGEFPPAFTTRRSAQEWIDAQKYKGGKAIVTLELRII
jgi:hypothetical protein